MFQFVQAWRNLVLATSIGLAIGLIFALVQEQAFTRLWRGEQERVALSQLQGMRLFLKALRPETEEDKAFDPNQLDAPGREFLEGLSKENSEAEIHWATQLESTLESAAGQPTTVWDRHAAQWLIEPTGYQRLRMSIPLEPEFLPYRQLDMSRRFSKADVAVVRPVYAPWVAVFVMAGLLVGLFFSRATQEREQLAMWLTNWSFHVRRADGPNVETVVPDFGVNLGEMDHRLTETIHGTTQDLHKRRIAIQASAERSSRVLSAMPIGVLSFDDDSRLIYVNRAGRELLDLNPQVQFGQTLIEVVRQPTVVNLIQQAQLERQLQETELEMASGKILLRLRAHPLASEQTDAPESPSNCAVLLTVSDETRLKQLENARRDFTANVSHELKTPLSAIKAYAETLLMGAIDDADSNHRFVERISEQAHRLDELIQDLLHLTRLQSQPHKAELTPILVAEVLRTCVEEHRPIGAQRKIAIEVHICNPESRVDADFESLRTIVSNLLSNAVRYSHPNGTVSVSTRDEGRFVVISIQDQGIGIPDEDLERIFERFYRVEKARSQDAGGTGLGLAIVKHLVNAIDGQIDVKSQIGVGSTFELRLNQSRPAA